MKRKNIDASKKTKQSNRRKRFKVLLQRSYIIEVIAESKESAMEYAEFFVGDPTDASNENDRKQYNFKVENIEMTYNNADEIVE